MRIINYCLLLLVICACKGYIATAQTDTIRVMAYNVLDYGSYPLCQGPDSFYNAYLETIVQYAHPDIISLEKMASLQTSPTDHNYTGAIGFQDSIIQYSLDAAYPGRYNNCPFTNYAANTYEDLVFYNQQKLGFVKILCTYTNTEDFNTYKLYYKDPNLAVTNDTTFIYVTPNHDISGSTNQALRGAQIAGEMAQIQSHFTRMPNMINMGDFNLRNTSEPLYQTLTVPADTDFRYYDPPFYPDATYSYPANWDGNPSSFSGSLTTTTRSTAGIPNNCGVGGGAKDWYDHIFLSSWIVNNENYISYIPHSYTTLGNDGHRLGISVNDAPTNTAVPANVANALYLMSDKYPVMVDLLATSNTTGTGLPNPEITPSAVSSQKLIADHVTVVNPVGADMTLYFSSSMINKIVSIECIDMLGRTEIHETRTVDNGSMQIPCNLKPGIYCLKVTTDHYIVSQTMITKE